MTLLNLPFTEIGGIPFAATILLLGVAAFTDLRAMIIPNWITLPFFISGLFYHGVFAGWDGLVRALAGVAAGFGPLLLLHLARGIGAGDVKLFGALGAWIGVVPVLYIMLYAILYAGVIGALWLILHRPFFKRMAAGAGALVGRRSGARQGEWAAWAAGGRTFPFMLAVVPGAVTFFIQ
ncbi:prepilin peptidase [Paenibacillus sp. NPDC058071]|uniref:A24 family peptidase n=1 Tax=Paenibacillus sp. NPDC058071 TaxID=3346326 RepID=UPI0036DA8FB0